ncbi:hypothetical protein AWZ03_002695 [Drosophila navojoa]|uniref:Trichohyalin-plectin-homology domain-containing protein n=1 Tax=Drosophila navojoa TaxID=7232 RepID=A0A484BSH3_DRONA|nr:trichohyalin-like [Drosophila navojoa]TDG51040.1 hypothetical protein AWZ03_002695 [Drosophila navojoa]
MSSRRFNKACLASPGHTRYLDNRKVIPTVLTAKRLSEIIARATMQKRRDFVAAEQEEQRYMQYLQDGNEALCRRFKKIHLSLDEEKQAKLDQEVKDAAILDKQVKLEDEQMRKERIYRANRILENMKPGQVALKSARLQSEVIFQRKYNKAVNRRIAEEAKQQQELNEKLCPEICIPYSVLGVEEEKLERKAKALEYGQELAREVEERRLRKLDEKEQENFDGIVERAQYQCLHELEKKAAKERAQKSREFRVRSYRDGLKEKAEVEKYANICEEIGDRIVCVDTVKKRRLNTDAAKGIKQQMAERIQRKEQLAIELCRQQQAQRRRAEELEQQVVDRFEEDMLVEQARRECRLQELAKERRAYELEQQQQQELRRKQAAEIRRFQVAERLKNSQVNQRFQWCQKAKKHDDSVKLRRMLCDQQDEFLARRQEEQVRFSSCQADAYLPDDVQFFSDALDSMEAAKKSGRPVLPIARAVETYRRENQIELPNTRMMARKKIRDYCWPGYYSKAELAFKNYEHRNKCLDEQQHERREMLEKSAEIMKMAAEEKPYKKCDKETPLKLIQHRGLPALESVDSFDYGSNLCLADDALPAHLNSAINLIQLESNSNSPINMSRLKQHSGTLKSPKKGDEVICCSPANSCSTSLDSRIIHKTLYSWR